MSILVSYSISSGHEFLFTAFLLPSIFLHFRLHLYMHGIRGVLGIFTPYLSLYFLFPSFLLLLL
jgi:hypothetical protein